MEVSGGHYDVLFREDSGVVGGAVDFGLDHLSHVGEGVLERAMHLRHAAERVGILHMDFMAADHFAALEVSADGTGGLQLSRMGANGVDFVAERLYATIEHVERKRSDLVGQTAETTCT